MKRLLLGIFIILNCHAYAQEAATPLGIAKGAVKVLGRLYVDSLFYLPVNDTSKAIPLRIGAAVYQRKGGDTGIYVYNGIRWDRLATYRDVTDIIATIDAITLQGAYNNAPTAAPQITATDGSNTISVYTQPDLGAWVVQNSSGDLSYLSTTTANAAIITQNDVAGKASQAEAKVDVLNLSAYDMFDVNHQSQIGIYQDSIKIYPYNGQLIIDSLNNYLSTTGKVLVWDSVTGKVSVMPISAINTDNLDIVLTRGNTSLQEAKLGGLTIDGTGTNTIQLINDATQPRNVIQSGDPIAGTGAQEGSITFAMGSNAIFDVNSGENNIWRATTDDHFEWWTFPVGYERKMQLSSDGKLKLGGTSDVGPSDSTFTDEGSMLVKGGVTFTKGAGANKVLTSDASGRAIWQDIPVPPSTVTLDTVINNGRYSNAGQLRFGGTDDTNFALALGGFGVTIISGTNVVTNLLGGRVQLFNGTSGDANLYGHTQPGFTGRDTLPRGSGVLALSVNGIKANSSGNISVTIPTSLVDTTAWHLTGDPKDTTSFIGTNNYNGFQIKTNSLKRMYFSPQFGNPFGCFTQLLGDLNLFGSSSSPNQLTLGINATEDALFSSTNAYNGSSYYNDITTKYKPATFYRKAVNLSGINNSYINRYGGNFNIGDSAVSTEKLNVLGNTYHSGVAKEGSSDTLSTKAYVRSLSGSYTPPTYTANRALVSNGSGAPAAATTTDTEIGYVNGVTSAIQTQLNAKGVLANPLSQFGATTSSQLLGVLSDETGSGLAVFATSPVLAGSPTTPTQAVNDSTLKIASTEFVQLAKNYNTVFTTTGTSTAYLLTPTTPIASYVKGQTYYISFHTNSGSSPTINISGLGNKSLFKGGSTIGANDLGSSKIYIIVYTGSWFDVLNFGANGTGTGSVVLATSPALTTPDVGAATGASLSLTGASSSLSVTTTNSTGTTSSSGIYENAGSVTTGTAAYITAAALTSGKALDILVNGSGSLTNQVGFNLVSTGSNSASAQTTYGAKILNSKSGSGTNVALNLSAINGSNNYSLLATGFAGFGGNTTPTKAIDVTGDIQASATMRTGGYTVATLPAGTIGQMAYVTDALTPVYLGALTGGGTTVTPVFYNGTAWVAH